MDNPYTYGLLSKMAILNEEEFEYYMSQQKQFSQKSIDNIMWKRKYEFVCNTKIPIQIVNYHEEYLNNAKKKFEDIISFYLHKYNNAVSKDVQLDVVFELVEYISNNIDIFNSYKNMNVYKIIKLRIYEANIIIIHKQDFYNANRLEKICGRIFGDGKLLDLEFCMFVAKYWKYMNSSSLDIIKNGIHKYVENQKKNNFIYNADQKIDI